MSYYHIEDIINEENYEKIKEFLIETRMIHHFIRREYGKLKNKEGYRTSNAIYKELAKLYNLSFSNVKRIITVERIEMANKAKIKGNSFEREVVMEAKTHGLQAKRAWGSNGKALGLHEEVDLLLEGYKVQCKRRKKLGTIVKPSEEVDIQVIREDRGISYAVLPLDLLFKLMRKEA